ncbi:RIIA protector from prophage-induced early lysis [Citromicrobium phage vB_CbaS-RXM]|nr:RIIA protector from prophage-induced early lysis [Citromicrobium phage vB_CbaS-RXM]
MKYAHKFAEVESGGLGETAAFKIAASGKAFRSLIDSIYSLKIDAPIRELLTNAWDAHIAAGKIEPFHVHLPSPLFPTFFVRDYGCSMSHEFVMERYTTLFDSTKDGMVEDDAAAISPDQQVGSWGLGSKTPFTYTDAFTLSCWMDGEVRIYHIFIGANGRPDCSLAHRAPSDEPTGVKVEFPVKNDDHDEFEAVAIKVLKGFNVLPTGLPTNVVAACQAKPQMVGSNFKVYDKDFLGKGWFARQGCVHYPIELGKLPGATTKGFSEVSASVVIDFPIGSVEYTNSREQLSYTPGTVASITEAFDGLRKEIEAEVTAQFKAVTNPFERAKLIGASDLFAMNRFSFLTEGHSLRNRIGLAFGEFLPKKRRGLWDTKDLALFAVNRQGERATQTQYTFAPDKSFPGKAVLIYCDEKTRTGNQRTTGISDRIGAWMSANDHDIAYVFDKLPKLSKLRKAGFPPVVRLTAVPALPKAPRQASGGGGFSRFAMPEHEIPANALFVFKNRGRWVGPDGKSLSRSESALRKIAKLLDRPIVSINTRSNEDLSKWSGYDLIYDYTMIDALTGLSDAQIKALVAVINNNRFNALTLSTIVARLDKAKVLHLTPLASLNRFAEAAKTADRYHKNLIKRLDLILSDATDDDDAEINCIIERGRALGCELLMPPRDGQRPWGTVWVTAPLEDDQFPKLPPMFFRLMAARGASLDNAEVAYITKEVFCK